MQVGCRAARHSKSRKGQLWCTHSDRVEEECDLSIAARSSVPPQ